MQNEDDDSTVVPPKEPNGLGRRSLLLAGSASLSAAVLATGSGAALARNVKRVQARPGFTLPAPKNWTADHTNDDVHPPIEELPPPLGAIVNEDNPLEYDLFLSMHSATGYLMLDRLLALNANYNVKMNFRPILPRQLPNPEDAEFPYTHTYNVNEYRRIAKFMDVPFEYPNPQVVVQDVWPVLTRTLDAPSGEKKQKKAYYISRMAASAALRNVGEAFLDNVYRMIWNGKTKDWPSQVVAVLENAGLDGKAMDADVRSQPEIYDRVLRKNMREQSATGHDGSAVAAFRQEPFPGQNRFDQLLWTLQRSGLTRKSENAVFLAAGHKG